MSDINRSELPGKSLAINGYTWERTGEHERTGFFQWARPLYHDERDWNRHDINIEGEGKFPAIVIELLRDFEDGWSVTVSRTSGPNERRSGMSGVLDNWRTDSFEDGCEKVYTVMQNYSEKYSESK